MTHTSVTGFAHAAEQAQQWVNELAMIWVGANKAHTDF